MGRYGRAIILHPSAGSSTNHSTLQIQFPANVLQVLGLLPPTWWDGAPGSRLQPGKALAHMNTWRISQQMEDTSMYLLFPSLCLSKGRKERKKRGRKKKRN